MHRLAELWQEEASAKPDKWLLFWASLVLPGAGQFLAGNWRCLPWFLVAGTGVSAVALLPLGDLTIRAGTFLVLAVAGLASAEHAKRLAESKAPWPKTPGIQSQVRYRRPRGRAVSLSIELDLPISSDAAWRRIADLPTFLTIDPFHSRITLMRSEPAAGVDVVLEHRAFGLNTRRFGRLLYWSPGRGYALSDLSAGGASRGFPHVFFVSLKATKPDRTTLAIDVCGKWTSPWIPVGLGMLWLRYVMAEHARLLRVGL